MHRKNQTFKKKQSKEQNNWKEKKKNSANTKKVKQLKVNR